MFKLVMLSCVLAVASASAIAPLGWAGAGWGGWAGQGLVAPLATPLAAPWAAPLAAPLATPWSVAAPVSAHVLRKRSAVLATAPVAWSRTAGLTVPAGLVAAPLAAAPLAAAPLAGAWGSAPWGRVAAWGTQW